MAKWTGAESRRPPRRPRRRMGRQPSRTPHDLASAARGKPPQRAQEHGPAHRKWKTAIPAQRPQARTDRRDRHRASGKSRGVPCLRGSGRVGVSAANARRAGARASPRIALLATSSGDLDRDRPAADARRDPPSLPELSTEDSSSWEGEGSGSPDGYREGVLCDARAAPPRDPKAHPTQIPSRDIAVSFLRLANLDSEPVDRLSRYETGLWRQLVQTLFALQTLQCREASGSFRRNARILPTWLVRSRLIFANRSQLLRRTTHVPSAGDAELRLLAIRARDIRIECISRSFQCRSQSGGTASQFAYPAQWSKP